MINNSGARGNLNVNFLSAYTRFAVVASNESGVAASCATVTVNEKRQPRDKRPIFIEYIDSCRAVETYPVKLEAKVAAYPPPEIEW